MAESPLENAPPQAAVWTPAAVARRLLGTALVVGVVFATALYFVDFQHLLNVFSNVRPGYLVALLACHIVGLYLHGLRTSLLFGSGVPFLRVFHASNLCNFINTILPFRAGEFAMVLVLKNAAPGGAGEVLSTVFVDRILSLISLLCLFLAFLPGFSPHNAASTSLVNATGTYVLCFAGIVAALFAVTVLEETLVRLASWLLVKLGKNPVAIATKLRASITGLRALFRLRTSGPAFLVAMLTWIFTVAMFQFGMLALFPPPPITAAVFATFLSILGVALVSTPGGVGSMHGAIILALSMFGVGTEQALAFAILLHGTVTAANIAIGFLSMHRLGFDLTGVMRLLRGGKQGQ